MKYLCVAEEYEKDGETRVSMKRLGELFVGNNGKEYAKLYHMPGTLILVREYQKPENKSEELTEEDVDF